MRPDLILGLGNPLMGNDGIGIRVAECLAADPRLPGDAEVMIAGADLLRRAEDMEGRRRVILIDASIGCGPPGRVAVAEFPFPGFDQQQGTAHHLSPLQAIGLLRIASPLLCEVRFTLVAIRIEEAGAGTESSPVLAGQLPRIGDEVLATIWPVERQAPAEVPEPPVPPARRNETRNGESR